MITRIQREIICLFLGRDFGKDEEMIDEFINKFSRQTKELRQWRLKYKEHGELLHKERLWKERKIKEIKALRKHINKMSKTIKKLTDEAPFLTCKDCRYGTGCKYFWSHEQIAGNHIDREKRI